VIPQHAPAGPGARGDGESMATQRKAPHDQQQYQAWKADATKRLKLRHQIDGTAVTERIWTQFYARGLDPDEAADRAQMVCRGVRLPLSPRRKKK
jgi:hypothetical protein